MSDTDEFTKIINNAMKIERKNCIKILRDQARVTRGQTSIGMHQAASVLSVAPAPDIDMIEVSHG